MASVKRGEKEPSFSVGSRTLACELALCLYADARHLYVFFYFISTRPPPFRGFFATSGGNYAFDLFSLVRNVDY